MLLIVLFLAQADQPAEPATRSPKLSARRDCRADQAGDDIVVCGRSGEEFRLRPLPERYERSAPRAELDLGGAKLAPEVEQGSVGGIPTNRVMLRLRIPL